MSSESRAARRLVALMSLCLCGIGGHGISCAESFGQIDAQRLTDAEHEPGAWLTPGRDYRQSYYSPLKGVNRGNVKRLGYAWSYDIDFSTAFEATPIVVDGVMFTSGNDGRVYALEARTGRLLWKFEPNVDSSVLTKLCCTDVNRGVAVWRGKVYVGSIDGYLYALDAATGATAWKVDTITDRSRSYSITGAPCIAGDLVIIGNGGSEFDTRGYVTAYRVATGEMVWRFFTVPGDPKVEFEEPELEIAARTWDPNSLWSLGLGGSAWDGMAYDPDLGLVYIGTGNAVPWNGKLRSPAGGDQLFTASILAINSNTGRLVWYYQTTPGDSWDYDATEKPILADLILDGAPRKVILHAAKNGFFYVLDRASGKLISAEPFVRVNWASRVDLATGRPVETGQGNYFERAKLLLPGPFGGHQWQPMSYNARTGLVYLPAQDIPIIYGPPKQGTDLAIGRKNLGAELTGFTAGGQESQFGSVEPGALDAILQGQPDPRPRLYLIAWDPEKMKVAWSVETTGKLDPKVEFMLRAAGVMSTASELVFQGAPDGYLRIYDARTGSLVHRVNVGTSMLAAPMTYRIGNEQYIAIMAGVGEYDGYVDKQYGKHGRIVAFKLGGGIVPKRTPLHPEPEESRTLTEIGSADQIHRGQELFGRHCAICHAEGRAPDLRRMSAKTEASFDDIVLKGTRTARGMGDFSRLLSQDDAQNIHAFVVHLRHTEEAKGGTGSR